MSLLLLSVGIGMAPPLMAQGTTTPEAADPRLEFFEKKIRSILSEKCYNCHSADTKAVHDGAAWPAEKIPDYSQQKSKYEGLRKSHWAWQPSAKPAVPFLRKTNWPAGEVDRFILAKLQENKLQPVADAKPEVLLRR